MCVPENQRQHQFIKSKMRWFATNQNQHHQRAQFWPYQIWCCSIVSLSLFLKCSFTTFHAQCSLILTWIRIIYHFHRDLSKNQISIVDAVDFANFTNLRRLDLAENSLRMIDNNTFGEIKSLEKLKLSLNSIVHIFQGAFDGLLQLKQL